MQELRRQEPELVEAERAIFAGAEGGEVIALSSDDKVEGGKDGGAEGGRARSCSWWQCGALGSGSNPSKIKSPRMSAV